MITNDDCERYQDALDRLFEGAASEDDVRRLRGHAASCPDCETLLDIHRHLHGAPQAELESSVPDRLVEGMWPRVELELLKDDWRQTHRHGRSPVWRWVAAVQAAAIVLLAVGALYLHGELESVKTREAGLTDWMASQQQRLSELEDRAPSSPDRFEVHASETIRQRRLESAGDVTVGEVTRYLQRLPAHTQVLDARGARRLLVRLAGELPAADAGMRPDELPGITLRDGLQAGEALRLIAAFDLDPSSRLPAGDAAAFSKWYD